eukprot:TRINITY_DN3931_c0_g1_i1.p1 TRINITY_DN3931_c0_g1~~TRINITY_DN3931_c0_g1_i1.p1  ORF type:complete len:748 (-),score=212.22 TRINITY_DN3931_c0_g1_i1:89-2332(-)
MSQRKIAVLTSGGDAPGMNAAIRGVARFALDQGCKVFGVYEGYEGLVKGDIRPIGWDDVGGTLNLGGTYIGTARCAEFRTIEGRRAAALNLIKNFIDVLVVIGGDGSLTGADLFRGEWSSHLEELVKNGSIPSSLLAEHGQLTIVGLLGSIDNDFWGTTSTIGADTALQRIISAADMLISTALSHKRNFILEVMGRDCGYLALLAAMATGSEYLFIPECPPPVGWEQDMCNILIEGRKIGRRCGFVILSEGAKDTTGKPITSAYVKQTIEQTLKSETRVTVLGHVQRGGSPTAFDRLMSTRLGVEAAKLAISPEVKGKSIVVGTRGNKLVQFDLLESVAKTKLVSKLISEKRYEEALAMRGQEFVECYKILHILKRLVPEKPIASNGLRVGVMCIGAPSSGMNPCVRAVVRCLMDQGHTVLRIKDGTLGLAKNNVTPFQWMDVSGWGVSGGCNIGTNRTTVDSSSIEHIKNSIKANNIQAILMVGGLDGYESCIKLYKQGKTDPELDIPLICIPASISNNLPCTEHSIGCDTALNNIQEAIDKIKQSALGTRRIYVIEVMGSHCGYLALTAGIISGAERVYMHEEGVSLDTVQVDVNEMKSRFSNPSKQLALVIVNEKASDTYTTPFLQKIYQEEGKTYWEVRESILGHLQQGGVPTIIDRVAACRMAWHACNLLMEWRKEEVDGGKRVLTGEKSGAIGLSEGNIILSPMSQVIQMIEPKFRRPKSQWWMTYRELARVLAQSAPAKY